MKKVAKIYLIPTLRPSPIVINSYALHLGVKNCKLLGDGFSDEQPFTSISYF